MGPRFHPRRLYPFGSVAEGRPLAAWSDIDIAVEGLDRARFCELAAVSTLRDEARLELSEVAPDPRLIGSVLQDLFTSCERVFRRVSSGIGGGHLPATAGTGGSCFG